jgi:hypothetical protein
MQTTMSEAFPLPPETSAPAALGCHFWYELRVCQFCCNKDNRDAHAARTNDQNTAYMVWTMQPSSAMM